MKRHIVILLLSLSLAGTNASAQWYLFPGVKNRINNLINPASPSDTLSAKVQEPAPVDTFSVEEEDAPEIPVPLRPSLTRIALALPFGQYESASGNMFDFYSGVLLALRDEGRDSHQIEINVFDTAGEQHIPSDVLESSDMIIGPVSESSVLNMAESIIGEKQYVISPLDPKVASITGTHKVIQVPSNWENQTDDALEWLKEDLVSGDRIVFIKESGAESGEYEKYLFSKARELGLEFSILQYNILQGLHIYPQFAQSASPTGTTRFIIASETESFVGDAIRNIALLQHKEFKVAIYGPAKIRSFANLETENFYKLSLKLSVSYYVDYNEASVKSFVYAYRALYNNEPNAFAFGGYDITRCFLKACRTCGKDWTDSLMEFHYSGLQSEFMFYRPEFAKGYTNIAVRRIQYNPDYTINIVR